MPHLSVRIDEKNYGAIEPPVLQNVAYRLERGQLIALFGPSGCGKSTCLRIVSGLDTAFTGEVMLEGALIDGPTRRIGLVFQEQVAFQWLTVAGNIQFGWRFANKDMPRRLDGDQSGNATVEGLAEIVGLSQSDLRKYPKELSGGMKQRMSFARALALKPELLLLDEPFSSLDFESRQDLQDVVLRINQDLNTTIIIVSHDPDEVLFLAERILLIAGSPATIVGEMTPDFRRKGSEEVRYTQEFQSSRRELTGWLKRQEHREP